MANCPHGLTTAHWFAGSDNYFDIDDRPDGVVRKYCAGPPRDWYFEHGWRRQLESQMDDHPLFTKFLEAQEIDASQVPDEVNVKAETADGATLWDRHVFGSLAIPTTTDVDEAVRDGVGLWQIHAPSNVPPWSYELWPSPSVDRLRDFIPLGWVAPWGERWYSDPRQPLQYRDWGAEASPDGEHWVNVLTVGVPIYDALVAERGDPFDGR